MAILDNITLRQFQTQQLNKNNLTMNSKKTTKPTRLQITVLMYFPNECVVAMWGHGVQALKTNTPPFIHTFTHRWLSQPRRATAGWSGAGRVMGPAGGGGHRDTPTAGIELESRWLYLSATCEL